MAFALFCGQSSFPRSDSATANRYRALADMTAEIGYDPVFLNRHPPLQNGELLPSSRFRIINVSGIYRHPVWIKRQILKAMSPLREAAAILKLRRSGSIEILNIYTQFSSDLLFYFLLSIFFDAKCVVHIVEYRSKIAGRGFLLKLNDVVFERICTVLFSRFVAISSLTSALIKNGNSEAKVAIIPPVCDFDSIRTVSAYRSETPYFLYCASLVYEDVAWFVIQSFLLVKEPNVNLVLVLGGELSDRIRVVSQMHPGIKILSNLNYGELIGRYKGACALLIPLRDIPQDKARYPQKVSEYLASERPIISCKVGDLGDNFINGVNAFLADNYDEAEFATVMALAISRTVATELIAKEGYKVGRNIFDIKSQIKKLEDLLQ